MRIPAPHAAAFVLLVLAAASCGGTAAYITDSPPATRSIAVDGRSDDWIGALSMIKDGQAEEGFLNDQDVLYICFTTGDESLRREIAEGGLTVWFDAKGGDAKAMGIRYPLGRPRRERGAPPEGGAPPQGEPAQPQAAAGPTGDDGSTLEVLRSGGSAGQKMKISDAKGLEIAASEESGLFVYELKIPLQSTAGAPLALAAAPGAKVGIGIEVPKSERSGRPPGGMGGQGGEPGGGFGGGMGHGGFGGGGGRMGHGMGGRGMGRDFNPDSVKGFKVWTYVKLSAAKGLSVARPF